MKKIVPVLVVVICSLGLFACNKKSNNDGLSAFALPIMLISGAPLIHVSMVPFFASSGLDLFQWNLTVCTLLGSRLIFPYASVIT